MKLIFSTYCKFIWLAESNRQGKSRASFNGSKTSIMVWTGAFPLDKLQALSRSETSKLATTLGLPFSPVGFP